ncbi:hypothetical protein NEISICOT_03394 [Neisseria sicca ATCC 29256]|uniref:Uncharacterized protein n=2 Tax=Neisseria sicca TaxID=490 RepID=I2NG69_NEISI|nr:hypothetical protein NEISICOT_03394 [Neisseria sicca ATCC 29256]EIG24830.1 hypothetical protein HMPREF1051_2147 [Neisseria sicca VK64]
MWRKRGRLKGLCVGKNRQFQTTFYLICLIYRIMVFSNCPPVKLS